MKTIYIIIITIGLSANTFAQQLNDKAEELPLLITLKYQNIEGSFAAINLKSNLYSQIMSFGSTLKLLESNFNVKTKKVKFTRFNPTQIDLKRELRNIMHKYPGDGNNLFINAKGLKH